MLGWGRRRFRAGYERLLRRELNGVPDHVAVIQDGNRRYARSHGKNTKTGHREGAETTEDVLHWCSELGVEELTLYAFSTENFNRDPTEREHLFDLLERKFREFADAEQVHEDGVRINAIGAIERLPERVQAAIDYAEDRTCEYDRFTLNVAVAYGGRTALLDAATDVARDVEAGEINPEDIDVTAIQRRLHADALRDVDLIVRTGGDERTSNFLPWHANGNEAAVYFCAPYWPEFSKVDFLRGIRTYEAREKSWRCARAERALTLVRELGGAELAEARTVLRRFREHLPEDADVKDAEVSTSTKSQRVD